MSTIDRIILQAKKQSIRDDMQKTLADAEALLNSAIASNSLYCAGDQKVWEELQTARDAIENARAIIEVLSADYLEQEIV